MDSKHIRPAQMFTPPPPPIFSGPSNLISIRGLFSGLLPFLMLALLTSCEKENPVVPKGPQSAQPAAKAAVGNYVKKPASVRKPSATAITHSSATIKWQKASRAEEYIVLRRALYADNPESSLSSVHRTSGLSYRVSIYSMSIWMFWMTRLVRMKGSSS